MEQITLGTAGHIDHGKSALVLALTGQDPDRWAEEKRRGITLDLGFAHFEPVQGKRVSLVDVPGHEGLIHNMLAGAQGFSGVLLVVAADEGPMPQTIEHFRLLQLLGIKRGLVVLTKTDLADPDLIELLKLELAELFLGSFIESAPILEVSAKTGAGIEALKSAIVSQFFPAPKPTGPFRLAIDRAFSLKGFGTVVSGTALSGDCTLESPLWLYPQAKAVKIRGIQSSGAVTEGAQAGMRLAFNLSGITTEEIERGMQLAEPGSLLVTRRIGVRLEPIEAEASRIKPRKWVQAFCHAAKTRAEIIPLGAFAPKLGPTYCLLKLEQPLALRPGDRLVLRGGEPERSLAGAQVLALDGPLGRRDRPLLAQWLLDLDQGDEGRRILAALALAGLKGLNQTELGLRLELSKKALERQIQTLLASQAILEPDKNSKRLFHPDPAKRLIRFFQSQLAHFHQSHPEEAGAPADYFYGKSARFLEPQLVNGFLSWAARQNLLAKTDNFYHLMGFQGGLSPVQKQKIEAALAQLASSSPNCPGLHGLAEDLGIEKSALFGLLKMAEKKGWVTQVGPELFYRSSDCEALWQTLKAFLAQRGQVTVIEFKELAGLSRKNAVTLLEYFDQKKLTFRADDHRVAYERDL